MYQTYQQPDLSLKARVQVVLLTRPQPTHHLWELTSPLPPVAPCNGQAFQTVKSTTNGIPRGPLILHHICQVPPHSLL